MKELAERLGVDRSTVSRALSEDKAHLVGSETREKVRKMAMASGYRPDLTAAALRRGRSQTVGVLVPDLENETFIGVIRTIIGALNSGAGTPATTPLIAETQDRPADARRLIETYLSRRVDAIISLASTEADEEVLAEAAREVPVILAVRSLAALSLPSALCDDRAGGAIVARHFAACGHKTVCQVRGPLLATTFKNRAQGFSAVCAEKGIHEPAAAIHAEHANSATGKQMLDAVMRASPRPTAVFAHNDALAIGLIEAMRERGLRIPEDISVAGFNDIKMAQVLATPLTTVAYPIEAVGRHAAQLVRSLIAGNPAPEQSAPFVPELVIRRST
ncbi:MAG: LacI family DNA-binding transcriptional regulator [Nitratireductor sp.]